MWIEEATVGVSSNEVHVCPLTEGNATRCGSHWRVRVQRVGGKGKSDAGGRRKEGKKAQDWQGECQENLPGLYEGSGPNADLVTVVVLPAGCERKLGIVEGRDSEIKRVANET